MIGAVHNRTENVTFGQRLSRKTIKAINRGLYNLSHRRPGVPTEKIEQYTTQFDLIKKDLAATGKPGTYMLKFEQGHPFIQFESPGNYKKVYFPGEIQSKMDVVQFPPDQLNRLAEFLKEFKTLTL